ncbi:hypothetical protein CF70_031115 [Cupriavidus sp. SK-3]|uniref:hypothetical protein n=1 Tax=Cupriavidus sp. SK-3 TaxID=1470558 RepID=UPI0004471F30|nr:hypothetical protein [Cupriavidus sp. SK-3]KDP89454.1 hypothetical protein CF70_031115 [Cupriavidus sp. SK-3]
MATYVERALFVVAPRDFGKSTILRSIFLDHRLGTTGKIPKTMKLADAFAVSTDRKLYLRLTSPHEMGETLPDFIKKTKGKMIGGRWCFAGPLHPTAFKKMPDAVTTVAQFIKAFDPERVRVALLWPNHQAKKGAEFPVQTVCQLLEDLQKVDDRVEVLCVDERQEGRSGLLLADFFDFT